MKSTMKIFLVVVLFCSTAFAEGNMGGGGLTDDGNMGGGGKTCQTNCVVENQDEDSKDSQDSILDFIEEYLTSLLG